MPWTDLAVAGKHVITVEGLGDVDHPHPLQERLGKLHASQYVFGANGKETAADSVDVDFVRPASSCRCMPSSGTLSTPILSSSPCARRT
jgi:aerobic-type carbon monoxide dehydrogenase small subunit (CoxS/CutS family)